jgi:D-glycerate 3-kinase
VSPETALLNFVASAMSERRDRPLVIGLCGSQGSGKSTLSAAIAAHIPGTAVISLDDLYLTKRERERLACKVHPLFATRGVPGTHDVPLGIATLKALRDGKCAALPRFDKARDDRSPHERWPIMSSAQLILFEGWCIGALPVADEDLDVPINDLERKEDSDATWRRSWNAALREVYPPLFGLVDRLVMLAAPGWDTVLGWRLQQEHALRATGASGAGVMDDAEVARFVSHYERLTRHILDEMPMRADLVLKLAPDRRLVGGLSRLRNVP